MLLILIIILAFIEAALLAFVKRVFKFLCELIVKYRNQQYVVINSVLYNEHKAKLKEANEKIAQLEERLQLELSKNRDEVLELVEHASNFSAAESILTEELEEAEEHIEEYKEEEDDASCRREDSDGRLLNELQENSQDSMDGAIQQLEEYSENEDEEALDFLADYEIIDEMVLAEL